ncbi:MAG: hypothetical protein ACE5H4_06580 [Candidatus Thorarchaeota archaeon]
MFLVWLVPLGSFIGYIDAFFRPKGNDSTFEGTADDEDLDLTASRPRRDYVHQNTLVAFMDETESQAPPVL